MGDAVTPIERMIERCLVPLFPEAPDNAYFKDLRVVDPDKLKAEIQQVYDIGKRHVSAWYSGMGHLLLNDALKELYPETEGGDGGR